MVSNDQDFVNEAYTKVVEMTTDAYFGSTLRVLYLLTLSGNFYSPDKFDASLSTDDNFTQQNLAPYPNPVENSLYISFNENDNNLVSIYDLNGKQILKETYNSNQANINTSSLTSGFYILVINNKLRYKIIKK